MVVHSASVINGRALRHSRVLASDELRNTYGFSPRINRELAAGVRDMLAAQPGLGIDALIRLDPLVPGGVPARLEEVRSDSFGAEKTLARPLTKFSAKVDAPADAPPHAFSAALSLRSEAPVFERATTKKCQEPTTVHQTLPSTPGIKHATEATRADRCRSSRAKRGH